MRLLVVVIAGCGFTPGTLLTDGASGADNATDGPQDATSQTCYAQWIDHTVRLQSPQPLSTLNIVGGYERDPFLTDDELTIYFSTDRSGVTDVWTATRGNMTDQFAAVMEASAFNSTAGESKLSITQNGLTAVVGSDRVGGAGGLDVWESTRATTSELFPAMSRTKVMMVETSGNDHDPTISASGLHLYLAPDATGSQHIVMASRSSPGGNFGVPMTLAELDSGTGDADPSPTPDERIIVFSSNRSTPFVTAGGNIWYATRAGSTGAFEMPRPVPDVNTDAAEGDPHLSADGCRLYFARFGGTGVDWDLYVSAVQ